LALARQQRQQTRAGRQDAATPLSTELER
ncbi:heme exporter protein CcmD, partial [Stenotrophomonas maltophilia]